MRVRAFEASLLLLLEPVLNPIWAWMVHGERPGVWSIAGAAVILAGDGGEELGGRPLAVAFLVYIAAAR